MKLFEPITIGKMELKNRIIMPAMNVGLGLRGRRARAFYAERAKGGAAAIIPVAASVDLFVSEEFWEGRGGTTAFIEGLHQLTDEIHQFDCKIGISLVQFNRFPIAISFEDSRGELVAPSASDNIYHSGSSALLKTKIPCRALTIEEIKMIISKFTLAACRVKEAGFDFVEFHACHGFFSSQFMSPVDNQRNDKYGGDLSRRMQYGLDVIKAMRAAVGEDFHISIRLAGYDEKTGGATQEDNIEFALELEKAGVDAIDVSVGAPADPRVYGVHLTPLSDRPMGAFAHMAAAFKQRVHVPVIVVGRINTPEVAEGILADGQADVVAIGRQLIADPYWPEKVAMGRTDDIVPCQSCNTCDEAMAGGEFRCAVNAAAGKEAEYKISAAEKSKKVFVVGGGAAGMKAAMVAAARGHQVTLIEVSNELGGQLPVASVPPYKEAITDLVKYLTRQLTKLGVYIRLGEKANAESIQRGKPDVVIVATGAVPIILDIPGVQENNVATAIEVMSGRKEVGHRVVVVGGGLIGCETAEFLADKGKSVTIVELLEEIGTDLIQSSREAILLRMANAGIKMETGAKVTEILPTGVVTERGGKSESFLADMVVLVVGMKSVNELAGELEGKVPELYVAGDCDGVSKLVDAIADGARIGYTI
ncbi:FAD-dependent oxidoreductase [Chloroflexota bacterium]